VASSSLRDVVIIIVSVAWVVPLCHGCHHHGGTVVVVVVVVVVWHRGGGPMRAIAHVVQLPSGWDRGVGERGQGPVAEQGGGPSGNVCFC